MNLKVLKVGKVAHPETLQLAQIYLERIRKPWNVQLSILKDNKSLELEFQKEKSYWIALAEEGKTFTTINLSKKLESKFSDPGIKSVGLIIGGPYGIPPEIKSNCQELLSLSPLTFTSDFALAILCEQLYRVQTVLNGQEYHHI